MKLLILLLVLFSILLTSISFAANCGNQIQCNCGDSLNESQTMWYNLTNCPSNGITISANNILLDCNSNKIDGQENGNGIISTSHTSVTIKNCKITDFQYGIHLTGGSTNSIIKDNSVSSNYEGITLYQSPNNFINNNTVENQSSYGILLAYYSSGNTVSNNTLKKNHHGIYAYGFSGYNSITGNIVISNIYGIRFYSGSGNNVITNNKVSSSKYPGLTLESSPQLTTNNIVSFNTFDHNADGIKLMSSHNNIINNNTITNNGAGILIYNDWWENGDSKNNIIQDNFINNSGIVISYGNGNKIINNIINNIASYSIWTENCNNNFTNNIGDGLPIIYANSQTNILNQKVALIFLCNAHGSTIQNVTVRGSLIMQSNGILLKDTNNTLISESNSSGNRYGVYLSNSNNNIIANNSFFNNSEAGVSIFSGTNNIITNNRFIKNGLYNYGYPLYVNAYVNSAGNIFNVSNLGNYWNDFDLNLGYPTKYIIIDPIAIDYRPLNDEDNDGYPAWNECNDKNPNQNPSIIEQCNGVDDNCNGLIDEVCSNYRPTTRGTKIGSV